MQFVVISLLRFSIQVIMSGGTDVKSVSRPPAMSGIPVPRSLLPSSPKPDTRRRPCDLPKPTAQTHKYAQQTPMHSSSLCLRSSSISGPPPQDNMRDSSQNYLFHQRTRALPAPRISRSAYSSPLTQRKVPSPHSKDTLDLGKLVLLNVPSHDTNRNTLINKNQTWKFNHQRQPLQFKRGEDSNALHHTSRKETPQREKEALGTHQTQSTALNNSNPSQPARARKDAIKSRSDSTSQSDEDMGTPEGNSPALSPSPLPLPPITFTDTVIAADVLDQSIEKQNLSSETRTPQINMATVAPFSYRWVVSASLHCILCVELW